MTVFIYALWQQGEVVPRYIGVTKDRKARWTGHLSDRQNKEKWNWLMAAERKINLIVLQKVTCRARIEGYAHEREWIRKYKPVYNKNHYPPAIFDPKSYLSPERRLKQLRKLQLASI